MSVPLSALDKKAVLHLRDAYHRNETDLDSIALAEAVGIDELEVRNLISRMVSIGAVEDLSRRGGSSPFQLLMWKILPHVATIAAQIETPPDRVEEFMAMLNRKESTYKWVIFAVGLAGIVTFLNQLFELVEHLRMLAPK